MNGVRWSFWILAVAGGASVFLRLRRLPVGWPREVPISLVTALAYVAFVGVAWLNAKRLTAESPAAEKAVLTVGIFGLVLTFVVLSNL